MKEANNVCCIYLCSTDDDEIDRRIFLEMNTTLQKKGFTEISFFLEKNSWDSMPEFKKLCELAEKESIDSIAIYSLAHICKTEMSLEQFFQFLSPILASKIRFISVQDDLDTRGLVSDFILKTLAGIKRAIRVFRGDEIKRRQARARIKGVHIGRPKKADDLKIQKLYRKGRSLGEIARELSISKGSVQYSIRLNKKLSS